MDGTFHIQTRHCPEAQEVTTGRWHNTRQHCSRRRYGLSAQPWKAAGAGRDESGGLLRRQDAFLHHKSVVPADKPPEPTIDLVEFHRLVVDFSLFGISAG